MAAGRQPGEGTEIPEKDLRTQAACFYASASMSTRNRSSP